ncbi:hypothetical protein X798_06951, partial [Onchocerca flexuosa]
DTILGGVLAVCCFFFNHGHATRVQWTPPLRESFGYPVFLAQILVITYVLKRIKKGFLWSVLIACLTTTFMLFWQAHIMDLLRAKFTTFANFHTRLYTCAREFDFIGSEDLTDLMRTLLLPAAGLSLFLVFMFFLHYEPLMYRDKIRVKPCAEFVIHAICFNISGWMHRILTVTLLAAMAYQGVINIQKQWEIQGEYSNPDQEALFGWISSKTKSDSVFAGPMPVMANVKLSTGRPIVNHPHYEDAGLRNRTLKVYSLFSRKPLREVYDALKEMGVNYYIFQPNWCDPHVSKTFLKILKQR